MPTLFQRIINRGDILFRTTVWERCFKRAFTLLAVLILLQTTALSLITNDQVRSNINLVTLTFTSISIVFLLGYTARQVKLHRPRLFLPWLMYFLALCVNPLAFVIGIIIYFSGGSLQYPSIPEFFAWLYYPFLLGMIALLPSMQRRQHELTKWLLDAFVVIISAAMFFWNFVVATAIHSGGVPEKVQIIFFMNMIGDVLILASIMLMLSKKFLEQRREPLWWLTAAMVLLIAYDVANGHPSFASTEMRGSSIREIFLLISFGFIILSALQQLKSISEPYTPAEPNPQFMRWENVRMLMPYIGMVLAFSVLFISLVKDNLLEPRVNAIWLAVIVFLVLLRHYLSQREIFRLNEDLFELNIGLEHRVTERTRELQHANLELSEREAMLLFQNLHDALTGLPNRGMLNDQLEQAIRHQHIDTDFNYGLFFMDLDGFKVINDTLGHIAGDRLLIQVAERLKGMIRGRDAVARLGGDEFIILLEGYEKKDDLNRTAERVIASFAAPFEYDGQKVYTSVSMGIVPGSAEYEMPADILRDADIAMYEAKASGKARSMVFTSEMRSHTMTKLMLEKDLRVAIERQELTLHYQPIQNLHQDRLYGFEALLRWNHPTLGMISPGRFIPITEANGQIIQITYWVIKHALQQAKEWLELTDAANSFSISINLSARLFAHPEVVGYVKTVLEEMGMPASCLIIEITESAIISDKNGAMVILNAFKNLGVKIYMDDFGTGYSSLSYLHQFPIDAIKIDQEFSRRIQAEGRDREMLKAIVSMADDLNLAVVVEGIETAEQMEFVQQLGCRFAQGYYISHPVPAAEARTFLGKPILK